jgi:hypothetical protein
MGQTYKTWFISVCATITVFLRGGSSVNSLLHCIVQHVLDPNKEEGWEDGDEEKSPMNKLLFNVNLWNQLDKNDLIFPLRQELQFHGEDVVTDEFKKELLEKFFIYEKKGDWLS